ncbi:hypothetical protein ACFXTN_040011 [Malus domestica]
MPALETGAEEAEDLEAWIVLALLLLLMGVCRLGLGGDAGSDFEVSTTTTFLRLGALMFASGTSSTSESPKDSETSLPTPVSRL